MNQTMTDNSAQDPAAIEQDIRRTQAEMSRTVDKIGDQLTPRNIFNALLDKADEQDIDARMLIDGARRNPIALGLIAAGAIWLVSDKDSKFPSTSSGSSGKSADEEFDDLDTHHRDYVSHMSTVEFRDGEDPAAYQHRRDIARANFMMVERRHDEDDHGFRQRLDDVTEKFREKRQAWSDSSNRAGLATKRKARQAASTTRDFYDSNPLVGGIVAAAVGAALGSGLPITRQEQDKLGSLGEKARDMVSDKKDQLASTLHDNKDKLVEKADQKVQEGAPDQQSTKGQRSTQARPEFSRT